MNSTHTARHEPPCLPALSASPPLLAVPVACPRRCCYGKQAQHDTRLATAWTDASGAVVRLVSSRSTTDRRSLLPPASSCTRVSSWSSAKRRAEEARRGVVPTSRPARPPPGLCYLQLTVWAIMWMLVRARRGQSGLDW